MQHFDRILGILLFLRSTPSVSAAELARQFDVSTRTIYRDLETRSALGVPLYAERGRLGGVRLLPGHFLPPLMFTRSEAIALLLGLTLQRSLRTTPFPTERDMAEKKLLAALPAPDALVGLLSAFHKRNRCSPHRLAKHRASSNRASKRVLFLSDRRKPGAR